MVEEDNPIRRQIMEFLYGREKARLKEIRDYIGVYDPQNLTFHLKILKNASLVGQDQKRRYMIAEKGRKTIEVLSEIGGR